VPGRAEAAVLRAVLDVLRCYGIEPARQNVGAAVNASGRLVMFGRKGDADIRTMIPAGWGAASGKMLCIETKRCEFDPARLCGARREHFDRQLARLLEVNTHGGYGFWVRDAAEVIVALERIRQGWRVVFEGDWPILTDEPVGTDRDGEAGGPVE
jgi:hypothetical protein